MILDNLHEVGFLRAHTLTYPLLSSHDANAVCFTPHWHERIEILVVAEGEIFFEISGKTYRGVKGDIAIINPCCVHAGYTKNKPGKYYIIIVDLAEKFAGNPFAEKSVHPLITQNTAFLPFIRDEYLFKIICEWNEESQKQYSGRELVLFGYLYNVFGYLFDKHIDTQYNKPIVDGRFKEVIEYINENYYHPITSNSICQKFQYDEAYFCRRFKKVTGLSPMLYIKVMRLEKAKHMIRNFDMDMHDIALSCGFTDTAYFQRCFKEQYGISPTTYRKRQIAGIQMTNHQ